MTIESGSILKDGTVATTGGTAQAFSSLGGSLGNRTAIFDGSTPLARSEAKFTSKEANVQASAPNGYTQPRRSVVLKVPLALDNGNTTVNTVKIELAADVETTTAEIDTLRVYAAQLIHDSDFDAFWHSGSTD